MAHGCNGGEGEAVQVEAGQMPEDRANEKCYLLPAPPGNCTHPSTQRAGCRFMQLYTKRCQDVAAPIRAAWAADECRRSGETRRPRPPGRPSPSCRRADTKRAKAELRGHTDKSAAGVLVEASAHQPTTTSVGGQGQCEPPPTMRQAKSRRGQGRFRAAPMRRAPRLS